MSNKTLIYLKGYANGKNYINTLKALNAAIVFHDGQFRKSGEPYIDHPIKVAAELLALGIDTDELLATALLHDVLEDCPVKESELLMDFGIDEKIIQNVKVLTKYKGITTDIYYDEIKKHIIPCLVKISDRCHNTSTMAGGFSIEKIISYIEETEQYVIPLCKHVKNFYPQYSSQIFVMKYHIESLCKLGKCLLEINK